ncbi:MAG: hypothetical protein U1B79_01140, partial [Candidatus Pacearchaeota archaeon]|nr:hypothetical protein [Candidatus Pacearchaeota archaeon]
MKRDFIFDLFGVYFLLLGTIAFVNFFILYGIIPLWFSHITLLFIGIGILRRNAEIIAVQLNIIMIPSFLWSIDFFHQLIIGKQLLGITNYFFESFTGLLTLENFISLQHIYTSAVVL